MLLRHTILALALSFALSAAFWLVWGVFVMPGFVIMSLLAAAAGVIIGQLAGQRLWVTALATIIVRLAIYFIATGS